MPPATARDRHRAALEELPVKAHRLSKGEPVIPTLYVDDEHPPATTPEETR